jgi:hypothetical protein
MAVLARTQVLSASTGNPGPPVRTGFSPAPMPSTPTHPSLAAAVAQILAFALTIGLGVSVVVALFKPPRE